MSSPDIKMCSSTNSQRFIGSLWAFFMICAICPSALTNPNLLSYEHEANTKLLSYKLHVPSLLNVTHRTDPLWTEVIFSTLSTSSDEYFNLFIVNKLHLYSSVDQGASHNILGRMERCVPDMIVIGWEIQRRFKNDSLFHCWYLLIFYKFYYNIKWKKTTKW